MPYSEGKLAKEIVRALKTHPEGLDVEKVTDAVSRSGFVFGAGVPSFGVLKMLLQLVEVGVARRDKAGVFRHIEVIRQASRVSIPKVVPEPKTEIEGIAVAQDPRFTDEEGRDFVGAPSGQTGCTYRERGMVCDSDGYWVASYDGNVRIACEQHSRTDLWSKVLNMSDEDHLVGVGKVFRDERTETELAYVPGDVVEIRKEHLLGRQHPFWLIVKVEGEGRYIASNLKGKNSGRRGSLMWFQHQIQRLVRKEPNHRWLDDWVIHGVFPPRKGSDQVAKVAQADQGILEQIAKQVNLPPKDVLVGEDDEGMWHAEVEGMASIGATVSEAIGNMLVLHGEQLGFQLRPMEVPHK